MNKKYQYLNTFAIISFERGNEQETVKYEYLQYDTDNKQEYLSKKEILNEDSNKNNTINSSNLETYEQEKSYWIKKKDTNYLITDDINNSNELLIGPFDSKITAEQFAIQFGYKL